VKLLRWVIIVGLGCSAPEPLSRTVEQGRKLYLFHGCAVCHGSDGRGNGPMSRNLNPRPRDFRDEKAYKQGRDVSAIVKTIEQGTRMDGGKMPGYPHIPEKDRELIATYVVSLLGEE